jgi:glutamate-1-semialdehyde 2,1-aminomutase
MELVAPAGPVYQAGTLSANPVAMCAGLAALNKLADGAVYGRLEQLGARLERALSNIQGLAVQRVGSIFWLCTSRSGHPRAPMRALSAFPADASKSYASLFHALLNGGIYLAPSGFEVGFLSNAHTESHVDELAARVRANMTA